MSAVGVGPRDLDVAWASAELGFVVARWSTGRGVEPDCMFEGDTVSIWEGGYYIDWTVYVGGDVIGVETSWVSAVEAG